MADVGFGLVSGDLTRSILLSCFHLLVQQLIKAVLHAAGLGLVLPIDVHPRVRRMGRNDH